MSKSVSWEVYWEGAWTYRFVNSEGKTFDRYEEYTPEIAREFVDYLNSR